MKSHLHIAAILLAVALLTASYSGAKASTSGVEALAGNVYYVSQSGSGTSCTSTFPCAVSTGMNKLQPGDTLSIKGTLTSPLTISKSGTPTSWIGIAGGKIAAPQNAMDALLVTGSYLSIYNLDVTGGLSFGVRVRGHNVVLTNVSVHDSVWENRSGSKCLSSSSGGWGRGLTFAPSAYNVEVNGGAVYNNCGEGIGFTQNSNSYMHGTQVFDNFSRNIYIGNAAYVTIEGINTYYSNPNFYRSGKPGRCIGLAIEQTNYSTVGNKMHDAVIRGNTIRDCQGINFYQEVAHQYPSNIRVENNNFLRVPSPQINIPGTNIIVRNNTGSGSSVATAPTPSPTTVVVAPPSGSSSGSTIDEKQAGFTYSPGWSSVSSGSAYGGSYRQTSTNGAALSYVFTGRSFSIIYKGGPSYRNMDVYIDGTRVGTINQQRSTSSYGLRWDYPGQLAPGTHAIYMRFVTSGSTTKGSIDGLIVR